MQQVSKNTTPPQAVWFYTFIVSILAFSGLIVPTAHAQDPTQSGTDYYNSSYNYVYAAGTTGNNYGSENTFSPFYVVKKVENYGVKGFYLAPAYCVDPKRNSPFATSGPFKEGTTDPKYNWDKFGVNDYWIDLRKRSDDFKKYSNQELLAYGASSSNKDKGYNLQRTLLNGYPYDSAGIQKELGLTEMQFRAATQAAIWYFGTDYRLDFDTLINQFRDHFNNDHFTFDDKSVKAFHWLIQSDRNTVNTPLKDPENDFPPVSVYENYNAASNYQRMAVIDTIKGVKVTAKKVWKNVADSDKFPVTVSLYANGKKVSNTEQKLSQKNNWTASYEGLPEYDILFKKIKYEAREETTLPSGMKSMRATTEPRQAEFETIITNSVDKKEFSLKTTVTADDSKATNDTAASVPMGTTATKNVKVTDDISATGFDENKTYPVLGVLYNVTDNKPVTGAKGTINKNSGKVDFGSVELAAGKKYVVHEYAYSPDATVTVPSDLNDVPTKNLVAKHADDTDKAQTIVTGLMVKTKVKVGQAQTTAGTVASAIAGQETTISDTVTLAGLDSSKDYKLLGVLVDITNTQTPQVVGSAVSSAFKGNVTSQTIDFGKITPSTNRTYVVYEYLYQTNGLITAPEAGSEFKEANIPANVIAKHQDNTDQDQLITTGGSLATTVSVGGGDTKVSGSTSAAAQVIPGTAESVILQVVDTFNYSNFAMGKTYTVAGQLIDVTTNSSIATATTTFTPTATSGTDTVDFGQVKLEAGHKYVVYETAYEGSSTTGTVFAQHQNPDDLAQTIVVAPKIATSLHETKDSANTNPVQLAAGKVTLTDTVTLQGLAKDTKYVLAGQLVDESGKQVADTVYSTVITGTGTQQTQDLTFNNVSVQSGKTYVAFETLYFADAQGKPDTSKGVVAQHKDLNDKAQTLVVGGSIKTIVTAGETTASASAAAVVTGNTTTDVTDTVTVNGFEKDRTYDLVGVLVEVDAAGKSVAVVATSQTSFTGGSNQEIKVDFGTQTLTAGKKYVVHEYAYARSAENKVTAADLEKITVNKETLDEKTLVSSHADNNDLAQTIVANPVVLGTTVSANGVAASETAAVHVPYAGAPIVVTDQVRLTGLAKDATYTVIGLLKDVTTGEFVATGRTVVSAGADSTTVSLKTLANQDVPIVAGHTYVAYEYLLSGDVPALTQLQEPGNAISSHKDDSDKAQTIVVGVAPSLATEVEVAGKHGSRTDNTVVVLQDAAETTVTDHIFYEGLQPGVTYQVVGRLMQLGVDGNRYAQPVEIAAHTENLLAATSGRGTWQLSFADVKLAAGGLYVVYETATPLLADGKPDTAHALKHENPNDYPQVIVVRTPDGEIPIIPGDGGGNFPPSENVPNTEIETTTPVATTPVTTTPVTTTTSTTKDDVPDVVLPGWVKYLVPLAAIPAIGLMVAPLVTPYLQPAPPAPAVTKVPAAANQVAPAVAPTPTSTQMPKRGLLAATGANVLWVLIAALLSIGLGAILLVIRRRRES